MNTTNQLPTIIIGAGRVGQALALLATDLQIPILAAWNRTPESSLAAQQVFSVTTSQHFLHGPLTTQKDLHQLLQKPAIIWLTVRDDALPQTAQDLAPHIHPDSIVFHTSGSLNSTLLKSAGIKSHTASLHPLQAITDPHRARARFPDSFWTLEGDQAATSYATELLAKIHVTPIQIAPEQKILYHAAANTAANLLTSLLDAATTMATAAGIPPEQAKTMLLNLAQSTLNNLATQTFPQALSGPVARNDNHTIALHEQAIVTLNDPTALEIYKLLTTRARTLK